MSYRSTTPLDSQVQPESESMIVESEAPPQTTAAQLQTDLERHLVASD